MDAGSCLKAYRSEIIEKWKQQIQEALPAARGKPAYALLDSLGEFLDEVIESLQKDRNPSPAVPKSAEHHARQRATFSDYNIEQILIEYRILGRIIFDTLDKNIKLVPRERDIILDFILDGGSVAAHNFARLTSNRETQSSLTLRQTESRLKLAVECAQIGIFDWDVKSDKLYWSEELLRFWGYLPNEFSGQIQAFWDRIHPDDVDSVKIAIQDSIEKRKDFELNFRVLWPDHRVRWISGQGRATFDDKGEVSHLAGVATDITERVAAAQKQKESEELFLLASRATQDLIWDWNLRTNNIHWNESISSQFGYPQDMRDSSIEWWLDRIHPSDRDQVSQSLQIALDGGESRWSGTYQFAHSNGEYRTVTDRGFIVRDSHGKANRMVGAMQDITERERAAQRLLQVEKRSQEILQRAKDALEISESRYRAIFENAPVGIAEFDPFSRKFLRVNPKYREMLGYTSDELHQKTSSELTYPGDPQLDYNTSQQLIQGKMNEYRHEKRYVRKDGKVMWAELSISVVREPSGAPMFLIAIALDIGSRKQSEERLIRALQQLREERIVRERFVSTLTHDLRTPLTAARMSTQLASRGADNPDRVIMLTSRTLDAIDRTDRMIQDLLDVNRINAGLPLAIKPGPCDFSRLVREVCEELTATYGAEFNFQIPRELTGYWSYRDMRRTVENLGSNAAKYGDTSRPITMRLEQIDDQVELTVHNFGPPIPAKDQDHIFDTFLRAQTSSGKSKGWGLGLSLVKGVIEAHHGQIRLESTEEKGTTFTITLPIDFRNVKKAA